MNSVIRRASRNFLKIFLTLNLLKISSILGYPPTEYESGQDKKIGPR